jgi:hypothetical protein
MPIAERLEVERLQLAQQDAMNIFRQHVEGCTICGPQETWARERELLRRASCRSDNALASTLVLPFFDWRYPITSAFRAFLNGLLLNNVADRC